MGAIFAVTDETKQKMLKVSIAVHPLTYRVITTHYGSNVIFLGNHDPLFDTLTSSRQRHTHGHSRDAYNSTLTFMLKDKIAANVQQHAAAIADRLFREHKRLMCWYVAAQIRALGKGQAKPAVQDWLNLHGITEDEYSSDAAYKLYQRFCWEFDKKNAQFSGRLRRKSSGVLSRKAATHANAVDAINPLVMRKKDMDIELAINRFFGEYSRVFSKMPAKLGKHVRIYMYVTQQGLTVREGSQKLGISRNGIHHALKAMNNRIQRNPTFQVIIDKAVALPQECG